MIGIIINVMAVALGGISGAVFSKLISQEFAANMTKVFGVCAICMGISSIGEMQNMPAVVIAVVLGTVIGLSCRLGKFIIKFGEIMQRAVKLLAGGRDTSSTENTSMMVTAIILFCLSSTGIYGSLDAGMTGTSAMLISKSVLDLFTAILFACSLGRVVALIAVPQLGLYLALFFAAKMIYPMTTPIMISDFQACGGFLLVATGCRIAKIQEFPIADMLPALILIMPLSHLWSNVISIAP
jgi:uncharacterized membrane protein YqgA involved in biofilm formation